MSTAFAVASKAPAADVLKLWPSISIVGAHCAKLATRAPCQKDNKASSQNSPILDTHSVDDMHTADTTAADCDGAYQMFTVLVVVWASTTAQTSGFLPKESASIDSNHVDESSPTII